ncbi:hypothetical protein D6D29_03962, partial [Aureobasidium pullulans]
IQVWRYISTDPSALGHIRYQSRHSVNLGDPFETMNQDQAQHWLWLLGASGSPTLPLTYCNDINMSLCNQSMDPGQLPAQCHFNGSITPFADLQQVENWPYPTTDYNLQALTALQPFGRISQPSTHLQDTRGSLVVDMTQDVSLMDNHPSSPGYHSDIGNPASFSRDNSNNSPRPSQRLSQRRYSFATLDSSFQHVCFERCCGGRVFSSASNLRRHQRERSRQTHLSICPLCNRSFYRRWTRDQHLLRLSCRRRWRSRGILADTYVDDLRLQPQ